MIISGGICSVNDFLGNTKALLYGFYPGQEGGNALADIIFGSYNPSAKLPVTMPISDEQLPKRNLDYNDDYGSGYRWFDKMSIKPGFPFGFGLSYTSYSYSNLGLNNGTFMKGEPVQVSFDVKNTGNLPGEEAVQLYVSKVGVEEDRPIKELKRFALLGLDIGETKTATFQLTAEDFYSYNAKDDVYKVDTGRYIIYVGSSSDSLGLYDEIQIIEGNDRPDLRITNLYTFPRYPLKGQQVTFIASVVNYGSGPSPGNSLDIDFLIGEEKIASATNYLSSIEPGQMALICADSTYLPGDVGKYLVKAVVDPREFTVECIEGNNIKGIFFDVTDSSVLIKDTTNYNIALNKPAIGTDYQDQITIGAMAVDGNKYTRWGVANRNVDVQTLEVDFLAGYYIDSIKVLWCPVAYPKRLKFEFKDTSGTWYTSKIVDPGYGGLSKYTSFGDNSTRHIRLKTLERQTGWIPYSLYELEVYGTIDSSSFEWPSIINKPLNIPRIEKVYPNPFSENIYATYKVNERQNIKIDIHDITGRIIKTIKHGLHAPGFYYFNWNGRYDSGEVVANGMYIITISSVTGRESMIIIKGE